MKAKLSDYLKNTKSDVQFLGDESQKGSIKYYISWYENRMIWYRVLYRAAGLLLISLAFMIPLWISAQPGTLEFVFGFGTVVVGLSTFYSFKQAWSGHYLAQFNLKVALDVYNEKTIRAKLLHPLDATKAFDIAVNATEEIVQSASKIINSETQSYFSSIKSPLFPKALKR